MRLEQKYIRKERHRFLKNPGCPTQCTFQKEDKRPKCRRSNCYCIIWRVCIICQKSAKQVYGINTQSGTFIQAYGSSKLRIAAMCCKQSHLYVIGKEEPEFIRVLDSSFYHTGNIASTHQHVNLDDVDMSVVSSVNQQKHQTHTDVVNDVIVISKTSPNGFVRVINRTEGVVWQLDDKVTPCFEGHFNPCSVSASASGDIYCRKKYINAECLKIFRMVSR